MVYIREVLSVRCQVLKELRNSPIKRKDKMLMPIRIYNTLGRKKEEFVPVQPGKVGMYVCGPTVYDSSHIGHARSVVVFDVIARYFAAKGFEVKYVRNFKDEE